MLRLSLLLLLKKGKGSRPSSRRYSLSTTAHTVLQILLKRQSKVVRADGLEATKTFKAPQAPPAVFVAHLAQKPLPFRILRRFPIWFLIVLFRKPPKNARSLGGACKFFFCKRKRLPDRKHRVLEKE